MVCDREPQGPINTSASITNNRGGLSKTIQLAQSICHKPEPRPLRTKESHMPDMWRMCSCKKLSSSTL